MAGRALQALVAGEPDAQDWTFLSSKDVDLRDAEAVDVAFARLKPDVVVHLAARVAGLYGNMASPVKLMEDNTLMNQNVLRSAAAHGAKRVVPILSTCVFPDKAEYPLTEAALHLGPPHWSNEGYAYAKRMMEVLCRLYKRDCGLSYLCLIPTNLYGPHDNFKFGEAHVMPELIHRCYLNKLAGEPFVVKGSGKPLRQFLSSADFARIILWAVQSDEEGSMICAPSDGEVSIATVAEVVASAVGHHGPLTFDTSFEDGQFRKPASNAVLLGHMPDFKFTPFEEGARSTVAWFVENVDSVRK